LSSLYCLREPRVPHSFPTRRSSDLGIARHAVKHDLHPRRRFPARRVQHMRRQPSTCHFHSPLPVSAAYTSPVRPAGEHGCKRKRSEEHTSELQSRENLVCRLLLEKK